ncbi:MAG: Radical SAM superfamily enzyme [Candidatus Methanohalarchaeum thermophilum]|uniref:Radical SAM superfamily enzyme n=1 Tax=Methanohalarchaeum thermophilum TaxID=1903181 RepID=A0A1Q6DUB8_METT1|nr:MAG: Radical SAM superfamily enzyme [Candidatus Methanohalarchaeum thermophilum]
MTIKWKDKKNRRDLDVLILDGYVDEPSVLGVPPYISPAPRLLVGAAIDLGLNWEYMTVDEYREHGLIDAETLLVHGGVTVPGKYLMGSPLNEKEAERIASETNECYIGGPLARYSEIKGYDDYIKKDLSYYLYTLFEREEAVDGWIPEEKLEKWLIKGSQVIKRHPNYPDPLIAEISLYRGCPRYFVGGCSFCSEPRYGKPKFREQKKVSNEIKRLYENGLRYFRIGGQSCTISYKARNIGIEEKPKPQPKEIKKLFELIWKKAPDIEVLHLDNANPAVISEYPDLSMEILDDLVFYTTPGNILALGLESADPEVIEKNNLNSSTEDVMRSIELINKAGREKGVNGLPKLLPGLNFLCGLKGETKKTYQKNFDFLKEMIKRDLLVRRINIRKVLSHQRNFEMKYEKKFQEFKEKVRDKIDQPMLKEILPKFTVLKKVYMEKKEGKKTFGRQIGSYPLLVGVPYNLKKGSYYDIAITSWGYRSVTGVEYPFPINKSNYAKIKKLPYIGDKKAAKIFRKKPIDKKELFSILGKNKKTEKLSTIINF